MYQYKLYYILHSSICFTKYRVQRVHIEIIYITCMQIGQLMNLKIYFQICIVGGLSQDQ